MRRRGVVLVVVGCLVLPSVVVVVWPREREPRYNGRTLSEWISRYYLNGSKNNYEAKQSAAEEADAAVRQIGTNALDWLVKWISYDPPSWKLRVRVLLSKLPACISSFLSEGAESRAVYAMLSFGVLQEAASPAVPDLMKLVGDTNTPASVVSRAANALSFIGQPALDPELAFLADTNRPNRRYLTTGMANMRRPSAAPATAVPILIRCLDDPD